MKKKTEAPSEKRFERVRNTKYVSILIVKRS